MIDPKQEKGKVDMKTDAWVENEEARVMSAVQKILAACDDAGLQVEFMEDGALVVWDCIVDLGEAFFADTIRKEQDNA